MNPYQKENIEDTTKEDRENQYQNLISRFSHEIRNPLTLINSSLSFLEEDFPELLQSELWQNIKQDIQSTILLVKDMSAFNNSSHIRKNTFSIAEFLNSVEVSFAPFMKKQNIRLTVSTEALPENAVLCGDEGKLREALTNLLLNAADAIAGARSQLYDSKAPSRSHHTAAESSFCGSGTDSQFRGAVTVTASVTDDSLLLHIRDNGPGIPSAYLETLFDPFVTHKAGGTGLGLGITQSIVKEHGGEITLDTHASPPDTYTDFCLRLPLR